MAKEIYLLANIKKNICFSEKFFDGFFIDNNCPYRKSCVILQMKKPMIMGKSVVDRINYIVALIT